MRGRKFIFAVVAVAIFFAIVEIALWGLGVQRLSTERDLASGFAGRTRVYEADSQAGVYRTPPRATAHSFNPQEFKLEKPDETLRIFAIGGSSAFGFPYGAGRAFPRVLGMALEASTGRDVEAINAAAMSYGSERLRLLTAELLEYEPDLLIVYGGHNEYVERDLHTRLWADGGELSAIRRFLSVSRLFSAMTRGIEGLQPSSDEAKQPEAGAQSTAELLGLDVDREAAVDVLPDERSEVLMHFEENIEAILTAADDSGVAVVLCTVPSNLSGWVPNQSVFAADRELPQRRQVEEWVAQSRRQLETPQLASQPGSAEAVLQRLAEANAVAPEYAAIHFWTGRALERLGRFEDARAAYIRARDADARPSRAESAINEILRELATRHDVLLVDIEHAFQEAAPNGLIGFNLFEDYVHPKPAAHRRIAFEVWSALLNTGWVQAQDGQAPSVPVFEQATKRPLLEVSDSRGELDTGIAAGNPSMLFNLAVVLENQGLIQRAMEKYNACLELHPTYYLARENLARLLFKQGRFTEATRAYRGVLRDKPDRVKSLIGLGESLRRLGGTAAIQEALKVVREAAEIDPKSADAYNSLGGILAQLNQQAQAENAFRTAASLDPDDPDTQVNLGLTLLFQQKIEEAATAFESALARSPHDLRARNGMGAVLTERGDLDGAETIFRENLRVSPGDPFATSGLQVIQTRRETHK